MPSSKPTPPTKGKGSPTNPLRIAKGLLPLAVPIDSLKPDPNNANEHPAENLAGIKGQLERMGMLKPLVATEDRIIRAGNGTWLAAKELGATHVAVIFIPAELEPYAEQFALADNQTARSSKWNPERLKAALDRMAAKGQTPEGAGFNTAALQALLAKARIKAEQAQDHNWRDATPSKARSKPGELWALGEHRLLVATAATPRPCAG